MEIIKCSCGRFLVDKLVCANCGTNHSSALNDHLKSPSPLTHEETEGRYVTQEEADEELEKGDQDADLKEQQEKDEEEKDELVGFTVDDDSDDDSDRIQRIADEDDD